MAAISETQNIPLWLDCDPGHDDAYALLLAAHDPRANLLGVSTTHGNASLKQTTFSALALLEAIGKREIKVYSGARKPIVRDAIHAVAIHGESGLDGVTLLPHPVESPVEGIDYLDAMYKALIATSPQTAWLISTGTLTNSALLFQKYPDLAEHLKGFTIMGGAIGGGFTKAPMGKVQGEGERFGNWTAFAEFNVYCDPEASSFLFSHPILKSKTTLIPLDLSHKVLGTKTVQHTLLYGSDQPLDASTANMDQTPSSLRALFTQIMVFFAGTYAEVFSITEGPPLHDPLAVSAAIDPDIFDDNGGERFQIDIVTEGLHSVDQSKVGQLGRTKATKLAPGEGGCRIPRGVSLEKFWGSIEDCLKRADKISSMPKLSHAELRAHGIFGDPA